MARLAIFLLYNESMKKILIPTLLAVASAPLISLVGCGDPQPKVESIEIRGIEPTYEFSYCTASTEQFDLLIVANIGGKEKDVSADANVEVNSDIEIYVTPEHEIYIRENPFIGDHYIHITAHYGGKDAEFNSTISIIDDGTLSFADTKNKYIVTPGEGGHTDSVVVNYIPKGRSDKHDVTNLCSFSLSGPPPGVEWDDSQKQIVWTEVFAAQPRVIRINVTFAHNPHSLDIQFVYGEP